jgi:predicted O-methyltransferase YrrM
VWRTRSQPPTAPEERPGQQIATSNARKREGDALQTLKADLPETIDLLLLDGAKALYSDVLALLEDRLRPGAFVVADNADVSQLFRFATVCPC